MTTWVTDAYKLSMAEAGYPLREETFYYSHRRGGPALLPFDVQREVRALLPRLDEGAFAALDSAGIALGAGTRAALAGETVRVNALPRGSWFAPGEPVFSITGPSALVSYLEPQLLMLAYRIQVATLAQFDSAALAREVGVVSCDAQRELVLATLDAVGVPAPAIAVDADGYQRRVRKAALSLIDAVQDATRVFEVGLRAATCVQQHALALRACGDAGMNLTSHVGGALDLGMTAVGTMGHEHVQRFGTDEVAFRAMRDRIPGSVSYLLDTFDTLRSGLPAALRLIAERGTRDSVRFDSGDKAAQYREALRASQRLGVQPTFILEDGFDLAQTLHFESLRRQLGVAPERQRYGYGGFLVAAPAPGNLTRDRVAAVFKLSQSGERACMKFSDAPGAQKQSVPGRPVLFRRVAGQGPASMIGQAGEDPPEGMRRLTDLDAPLQTTADLACPVPSPETAALVAELTQARARVLEGGEE
ncbi:MAG: hypothetical protein R3B13_27010 [Polyangiaceae bacterium]